MNNTHTTPADCSATPSAKKPRQQPIPLPSEPRQYRAIGLIQGIYEPSPESLTKGILRTAEGIEIEAVLLGRVLSLLKKHIDLKTSHLWVVYPRTRQSDNLLHVQIAGMWEPEQLHPEILTPTQDEEPLNPAPLNDGYFSVRGEVIFYSQEEEKAIVRVQQAPRQPTEQPKVFKVHLKGLLLTERVVGHFWDLHLIRQDNALLIQEAHNLGRIPKKRPVGGRSFSGQGGDRARLNPGRRFLSQSGESLTGKPLPRRENPTPKPLKRKGS